MRNPWKTQPIMPEVWAEADTLSQVLWQVAQPLAVPVVVCRGNSSLSLLHKCAGHIANRWQQDGQHTAILYSGDFDPAGMDMSDQLHTRLVEVGAPPDAFTVERVAVTIEQIWKHRLPPHEPKKTDRRTPAFVRRYGFGCVEADALPPEALVQVVEDAIWGCVKEYDAWDSDVYRQKCERATLLVSAENNGPKVDQWAADVEAAGDL